MVAIAVESPELDHSECTVGERCWFYTLAGDQNAQGPLTKSDMFMALKRGDITPMTLVWNGITVPEWTPLDRVSELAFSFARKSSALMKPRSQSVTVRRSTATKMSPTSIESSIDDEKQPILTPIPVPSENGKFPSPPIVLESRTSEALKLMAELTASPRDIHGRQTPLISPSPVPSTFHHSWKRHSISSHIDDIMLDESKDKFEMDPTLKTATLGLTASLLQSPSAVSTSALTQPSRHSGMQSTLLSLGVGSVEISSLHSSSPVFKSDDRLMSLAGTPATPATPAYISPSPITTPITYSPSKDHTLDVSSVMTGDMMSLDSTSVIGVAPVEQEESLDLGDRHSNTTVATITTVDTVTTQMTEPTVKTEDVIPSRKTSTTFASSFDGDEEGFISAIGEESSMSEDDISSDSDSSVLVVSVSDSGSEFWISDEYFNM